MTGYRADIDGIRALAIIVVVLFHAGFETASGGFVGVDFFFVISGYLISSIIVRDLDRGRFSIVAFYRRRIARILPSLMIVLFLTLILGFFLLNIRQFDQLGKETFFAAFGISNILFSFGSDYFAADDRFRPLLHTWSLGVEEQFYLIWPTLLIVFYSRFKFSLLAISALLASLSLTYSVLYTDANKPASYFLLQYRAFELILGAIAFSIERKWRLRIDERHSIKEAGAAVALVVMGFSVLLLHKDVSFPGIVALFPTVAVLALILLAPATRTGKALSWPPLVYLGIISYPLYLLHQPALVFLGILMPDWGKTAMLVAVIAICVPISMAIQQIIEKPLRKLAKQHTSMAVMSTVSLIVLLVGVAGIGVHIAKDNGWPWRLYFLNSYAYDIANKQRDTFFEDYDNGFLVDETRPHSRILFIGDSIAQQYVKPFIKSHNINPKEVDIVSRGECLLLKGINTVDRIAGVSCRELRERLFKVKKHYDIVFIAHNWQGYMSDNETKSDHLSIHSLATQLEKTVTHLEKLSKKLVVLGWHPHLNFSSRLIPTVLMRPESYQEAVKKMSVINWQAMEHGDGVFLSQLRNHPDLVYIRAHDLWCGNGPQTCKLQSNDISYFYDVLHFGDNAVPFVAQRLREFTTPD